jgi:phosphoribosylformylglycinamidine cyclo-ligase
VHGLSHITGGGIVGNTKRIIPSNLGLSVDWEAWERPAIFRLIQRLGEVPEEDMRRTFNLGMGMILVVAKRDADRILRYMQKKGEPAKAIGEVVKLRKTER